MERQIVLQAEDLIKCSGLGGPEGVDKPGAEGPRGITGPEVGEILGLRRKASERILNELVKRKCVYRILESDGKTHVNRYIHIEHLHAELFPPVGDGSRTALAAPGAVAASQASQEDDQPEEEEEEEGRKGKRQKRLDITLLRRIEKTKALLQERGVLTPLDLKRAASHDEDGLGNSKTEMDRKSALRIMEAVARQDSRAKLDISGEGTVKFVYWSPTFTKEAATARVQEDVKARLEQRFSLAARPGKRSSSALAITDNPSQLAIADSTPASESKEVPPSTSLALLAPPVPPRPLLPGITGPGVERRVLPQSVSLPVPNRLGAAFGEDKRHDQRILHYYGFHNPLVARAQLIHGMLLNKLGLEDGAAWTVSQVVDEMNLEVFLQAVGCGVLNPELDELLLSQGPPPRMKDLPEEVKVLLMNKTMYSGAFRTMQAVRRLLSHLAKLGLVMIQGVASKALEQTAAAAASAPDSVPAQTATPVQLRYRIVRRVDLFTFTADAIEEPPANAGSFDFAEPAAFASYWRRLQELTEDWFTRTRPQDAVPEDEGSLSSQGEDNEGGNPAKAALAVIGGRALVPLPANPLLPELFKRKNWKRLPWMTPFQRAAINDFYGEMEATSGKREKAASEAPPVTETQVAIRGPLRVLTARSAEVLALSRQICVAADRIVKHCKQRSAIGAKGPE
ncbi:unnamed protein product, partial [Polarella glacialis]